jgi:DNA primase
MKCSLTNQTPNHKLQRNGRHPVHSTLLTEIKARIDLADLAGELGIRRKHGGWLCPFHPDTNPSFNVRGRGYRCFACGAKGDAIKLVMEFRGLGFREAVEYLARHTGIRLPPSGNSWSAHQTPVPPLPARRPGAGDAPAPVIAPERRVAIYTTLARAARLHERLPADHPALAYLRRRGISAATAIACGIGALAHYERACDFLLERASPQDLQACGLFNRKGNLRLFAHRLLIPTGWTARCTTCRPATWTGAASATARRN